MSKEESMVLNWVHELNESNHFENTTDEILMHVYYQTRSQVAKEISMYKSANEHSRWITVEEAELIAMGQK